MKKCPRFHVVCVNLWVTNLWSVYTLQSWPPNVAFENKSLCGH
jgi:hypothetical protein